MESFHYNYCEISMKPTFQFGIRSPRPLTEGIFNYCFRVFVGEGGVKHKRITCGILGDLQKKSVNQGF